MSLLVTSLDLLAQTAPSSPPPTPPSTPAVEDTPWAVYAIICFGFAMALLVLELFVPSGGVLGGLAGVCVVVGIVMFFQFDTTWGMAAMGASLLAVPFVIAGMLWLWPHTPVGKALTLAEEQQPMNDPDAPPESEHEAGVTVGLEGEAITELRPVGACRLGDQRVDCIAQSGMIEPGTKVRVVAVEGMTVKVKGLEA